MFDTQKILVRPSGAEGPTFSDAKWSDYIPKLLQARIIESFENANMLRSVLKPIEGLTASRRLLIDIRDFQLAVTAAPQAEIELSAKILGDNGKIMDARISSAQRLLRPRRMHPRRPQRWTAPLER